MYATTTSGIKVTVEPEHLIDSSSPGDDVFAFAYNVKIHNLRSDRVQLLERHWIIMSGDEQMAEVVGPGVVGEQPVLDAGEIFEYASGAVIKDPIGSMEGTYTFRADDGEFFEVVIPRFELLYPMVVH